MTPEVILGRNVRSRSRRPLCANELETAPARGGMLCPSRGEGIEAVVTREGLGFEVDTPSLSFDRARPSPVGPIRTIGPKTSVGLAEARKIHPIG